MKRGDWLVLIAALALVPSLYAAYWGDGTAGDTAVITVDGREWGRVDLHAPRELLVEGRNGPSRLLVADGRIRFVDSPCSGKLCIHQGWISAGGEFAACLPNRVSVQVLAAEPRYDSIAF
jgi:hypothetical protein